MVSRDQRYRFPHTCESDSVSHYRDEQLITPPDGFHETDVNAHPSVEEIAAYLSGRISGSALAALESHLAGCRNCREEVTSARALMKERVSSRRHWLVPAAAAALLLMGILIKPPNAGERERASSPQRASGRESIVVLSPRGATTDATVSFAWRSVGSGALYALNLSDSTGTTVWETQTADTSITLPRSVTLLPGTVYMWYIDASIPNGLTATSGIRSFRVAR